LLLIARKIVSRRRSLSGAGKKIDPLGGENGIREGARTLAFRQGRKVVIREKKRGAVGLGR